MYTDWMGWGGTGAASGQRDMVCIMDSSCTIQFNETVL